MTPVGRRFLLVLAGGLWLMAGAAPGFADQGSGGLEAREILSRAIHDTPRRDDRIMMYVRAAKTARAAIEAEPDAIEARLQLVIALGLIARSLDPIDAFLRGGAKESRELLEFVLTRAPDNPWAHALMGGWHLEIVRRGGESTAQTLYGANEGDGLRYLKRAFVLAPQNILINSDGALILLALDSGKYAGDAREALARALAEKPMTAAEEKSQARAKRFLETLDQGDDKAVAAMITQWVNRDRPPPGDSRRRGR